VVTPSEPAVGVAVVDDSTAADDDRHVRLLAVYPALTAFGTLFLWRGIHGVTQPVIA